MERHFIAVSFELKPLSGVTADIGDTDQPIPLPNVSSNVLKKVSPMLCLVASSAANKTAFYGLGA